MSKGEFVLIYFNANISGHSAAVFIYEEEQMTAKYRTMEEIRAEADCEYHVFYDAHGKGLTQTKVIANDHVDARQQVEEYPDCHDVRLILKGEFVTLWQG